MPLHGIFDCCIQSGLCSRACGEAASVPMTVLILLGCEWCCVCTVALHLAKLPASCCWQCCHQPQHHSSLPTSRGLELCKSLLTLKLVPKKTAAWPLAGLGLARELGRLQFRQKGQRAWLSKCEDNLKFHFASCVFTREQLNNSQVKRAF